MPHTPFLKIFISNNLPSFCSSLNPILSLTLNIVSAFLKIPLLPNLCPLFNFTLKAATPRIFQFPKDFWTNPHLYEQLQSKYFL